RRGGWTCRPADARITARTDGFIHPFKERAMALAEYRAEGGIATITLNNAPANLYTHEMMLDLDKAILQARFDDSVHAIVLTGMGEKFFCAGADIKMLSSVT